MKASGWIDKNGKWYGLNCMGHLRFAMKIGYKGYDCEKRMRDDGWVSCSESYVFASRINPPTQAQQDKVYKHLKRICLSKYEFDEKWEEFIERYVTDYGGISV